MLLGRRKVTVICSGTTGKGKRCAKRTKDVCGHCNNHHPKGCKTLQPGTLKPGKYDFVNDGERLLSSGVPLTEHLTRSARSSTSPEPETRAVQSQLPSLLFIPSMTTTNKTVRAVFTPNLNGVRFTGRSSTRKVSLRYRKGSSAKIVLGKISRGIEGV